MREERKHDKCDHLSVGLGLFNGPFHFDVQSWSTSILCIYFLTNSIFYHRYWGPKTRRRAGEKSFFSLAAINTSIQTSAPLTHERATIEAWLIFTYYIFLYFRQQRSATKVENIHHAVQHDWTLSVFQIHHYITRPAADTHCEERDTKGVRLGLDIDFLISCSQSDWLLRASCPWPCSDWEPVTILALRNVSDLHVCSVEPDMSVTASESNSMSNTVLACVVLRCILFQTVISNKTTL